MTEGTPPGGPPPSAAPGGGDLVGTVLADRYRILRKLGEGAMGAVYLGEHLRMGRKDAIKVISRAMAGSTEALARFEREARNASFINHPHVCQIYDFGETGDGLAFLAMEFVEGEPLGAILEREGGRLPAARAIPIVLQTAEALEAAHARNIVHRDLKPDNIMITRGRDGSDVVKVVDFGIAKGIGDDEGQAVTRLGFVIGTPEYMSPEQLSGDRLDGRSDVYSLALVLVRLLTGTFPFPAATAQELMLKRLTEDPRPLAELAPGVAFPPGLQGVLDRALARSAADRHPSASAFRQELEAVRGTRLGAPLSSGGAIPSTQVAPAAAGATGPKGAFGAPAGSVAAGSAAGGSGAAGGGPGGGRLPVAWIAGGAGGIVAVAVIAFLLLQGDGEAGTPPADPGSVAGAATQGGPGTSGPAEGGSGSSPGAPGGGTGAESPGGGGTSTNPGDPPQPPRETGTGGTGPAAETGSTGTPSGPSGPADPAPGPRIAVAPADALDRLFGMTDRLDALNAEIAGTDSREAIRDLLAAGGGRTAELRRAMDAARDTLEAMVETPGIDSPVRAQAAFETANLLRATPGVSREQVRSFYERATQLEPGSALFRQALQDFLRGGAE